MEQKTTAWMTEATGEPVTYWLDDLQCSGDENSLFDCPGQPLGENNCRPNERAAVNCLSLLLIIIAR